MRPTLVGLLLAAHFIGIDPCTGIIAAEPEEGTPQFETVSLEWTHFTAVGLRPDGQRLALILNGQSERIDIHDARSGKVVATYKEKHLFVDGPLAYTPDGKYFLCTRSKKNADRQPGEPRYFAEVLLRSPEDGKILRSFDVIRLLNSYPCKFALTSEHLVTQVSDGDYYVYSLSTGKELHRLPAPAKLVRLQTSANGRHLVTCDEKGTVSLWDVGAGKLAKQVVHLDPRFGRDRRQNMVSAVAVSNDGATCAASVGLGNLVIYDVKTGKEKARTNAFLLARSVSFSDDEKTLVGAGWYGTHGVVFWDWQESRTVRGGGPSFAEGYERLTRWQQDLGKVRVDVVGITPDRKWMLATYASYDERAGRVTHQLRRYDLKPISPEPPRKKR